MTPPCFDCWLCMFKSTTQAALTTHLRKTHNFWINPLQRSRYSDGVQPAIAGNASSSAGGALSSHDATEPHHLRRSSSAAGAAAAVAASSSSPLSSSSSSSSLTTYRGLATLPGTASTIASTSTTSTATSMAPPPSGHHRILTAGPDAIGPQPPPPSLSAAHLDHFYHHHHQQQQHHHQQQQQHRGGAGYYYDPGATGGQMAIGPNALPHLSAARSGPQLPAYLNAHCHQVSTVGRFGGPVVMGPARYPAPFGTQAAAAAAAAYGDRHAPLAAVAPRQAPTEDSRERTLPTDSAQTDNGTNHYTVRLDSISVDNPNLAMSGRDGQQPLQQQQCDQYQQELDQARTMAPINTEPCMECGCVANGRCGRYSPEPGRILLVSQENLADVSDPNRPQELYELNASVLQALGGFDPAYIVHVLCEEDHLQLDYKPPNGAKIQLRADRVQQIQQDCATPEVCGGIDLTHSTATQDESREDDNAPIIPAKRVRTSSEATSEGAEGQCEAGYEQSHPIKDEVEASLLEADNRPSNGDGPAEE